MKSKKLLAAVLLVMLSAQSALAHAVWYATRLGRTQLVLGEGPDDRAYSPESVLSLQGYDSDYGKVELKPIAGKTNEYITVEPADNVAVAATVFSYGYWLADENWKNWKKVTDSNKDAENQIANLKYNVHYFGSVKEPKPIEGLPFQLVPMSDPTGLKVGDELVVQVLKDGKPMSDAEVFTDFAYNANVQVKTDSEGKVSVPIRNATFNVIGIEANADSFSDPNNPKVTRGTFAASLSFLVK